MKIEYSDLPKNQQHNYILSETIILGFGILFAFVGWFMFFANIPNDGVLTNLVQTDLEKDTLYHIKFLLFFGGVAFGMMWYLIGMIIGITISEKMNLFTNINFENAEKRLEKIKEALS